MKHRYRIYLLIPLAIWLTACQPLPVTTQAGDSTVTAPFRFPKHQIMLSVLVDGSGPYNMLLDSGTDPSAIDINLARSLGMELTAPATTGTGAGAGSVDVIPTTIKTLQVGNFRARDIDALALDLSALGAKLGMPLHGVLGYSLLQNRIVEIDYPRLRIRVLDSPGAAEPAISLPMMFTPEDNIPVLRGLEVNGVSLLATLDTGSSRTLTLYPAAVSRLGIGSSVDTGSHETGEGFAGKSSYRAFPVSSVAIDSLQFGSQTVFALTTGNRMATSELEPQANIGNGLLKYCVLRLDYKNKLIGLRDCQVTVPDAEAVR
jgi:predicted aspartyl protease